ncbi:MAG: C40 family peptidase [Chitinispirillaceae bacterium]|nr:C40 family peptidase [Chitinispirillaceae bacterium]
MKRIPRQQFRRFVRAGIAAGVACCFIGCGAPIRYTRNGSLPGASKQRLTVPRTWDYRKTYSIPGDRLAAVAARYIGIRYRYGGMSRRGTDCSGLVCMIYREVCHAKLPRTTGKQRAIGRKVSLPQAKSGDLVFFRGGVFGRVSHVGIYLSGRKFIHASRKRGVIYSNLDDAYYKEHFVEARRIFR